MFLSKLKKRKSIVLVLLLIILLIMPFDGYVYYTKLYYIIVILVYIPLAFYQIIKSDSIERKFYYKWERKRKRGRLANIFSEALRSAFSMVAFVFGGMFIVNGYTPIFILSELPIKGSIGLMIFVFIFSIIIGIIAWYENEKKFYKISLKLDKEK